MTSRMRCPMITPQERSCVYRSRQEAKATASPPRSSPSLRRLLRQEMLYDFPAGGTPHTVMRADIVESRIESADAMRLSGHERMDRDRHDARDRFTLTIERVELTPQHRLEFGNRNLHFKIGRDVVGLDRIGQ